MRRRLPGCVRSRPGPALKYSGLKAEGREALRLHLLDRAFRARERHGPSLDDAAAFEAMMADRGCVRFPTEIVFDDAPLAEGQLGCLTREGVGRDTTLRLTLPAALESAPEADRRLAIAWHVPAINYGGMPTDDDAAAYVATLFERSEAELRRRLEALPRRRS